MNKMLMSRSKRYIVRFLCGLLLLLLISFLWPPSLGYLVESGIRSAAYIWKERAADRKYPEEFIRAQLRTGQTFDVVIIPPQDSRCINEDPDSRSHSPGNIPHSCEEPSAERHDKPEL